MDVFLPLIVGICIGILVTWLWISIRDYWKRSKDFRSSSAKARKEVQEKAMKARLDAQKARSAVLDAGLRVFFLLLAIVAASWLVWMFVMTI